jgi:hypothetical protein
MPPTSHALTPAVPPSYPSDSLSLDHSVRSSVLCSTAIIFEREHDSFCRSLSSIRKYYLNSWSTMCMSMSAACVTKARLVNSRSYSDHDVNCNYMQEVVLYTYLLIPQLLITQSSLFHYFKKEAVISSIVLYRCVSSSQALWRVHKDRKSQVQDKGN